MGRRGPPKKRTDLRLLNNNAGKHKISENEPKPEKPKTLRAPSGLTKEERKVWRSLVKRLEPVGLYTVADEEMLIRYCTFTVRYQLCRKIINEKIENGESLYEKGVSKTGSTYYSVIPEVKLEKDYDQILRRIEQEFGMSPASRTGLEVFFESGAKGDKLSKWKNRRGTK